MAETRKPGTKLVLAGGIFALAAVFLVVTYFHGRRPDDEGPSKLLAIHPLALADGKPVLLLVEQIRHPTEENPDSYEGRIDVVDAVSGKRIVRKAGVDVGDCLVASPGRIWCDERTERTPRDRSLVLRDLATLAVVDADAGAAPAKSFGRVPTATVPGDKDLGFAGPGRQPLVRRTGSGPDTPVGSATYLDPSFLADGNTADLRGAAIVLDDDIRIIVHVDTPDRPNAKTILTAVDASGASRWQVEVGKGRVMRAWRQKAPSTDLVVVAMQSEQSVVVAIDPKTGKIAWHYET